MNCPKCGKEFSEPILPLHIARCNQQEVSEELEQKEKEIEKMNKEELIAKAKELELEIEDEKKITKAQLIELINQQEVSE